MSRILRTYDELISFPSFEERFEYLKIGGRVGEETFGSDRYLNQMLYHFKEWRAKRNEIIVRDLGHDLAMPDDDYEIFGRIIIHHMNPITIEDIERRMDYVLDSKYLITTSLDTHNAIHYGDKNLLRLAPVERRPGDTCPWKKV